VFFAGVFEKNVSLLWCFGGQLAVKSLAKRGKRACTLRERKSCHFRQLYFFTGLGGFQIRDWIG
jgi:hypothetical protein